MLLEALEWGGDKYREENQDIINFVENYSDKYEEIRIVLCSNIRRKNGNIEYGYYSGGVTFIDGDNVYFVSSYAQKSINEDKAEMFSYLLEKGKYGSLPLAYKSPHIKKRTKMIIDEIDKYFDTVDENAYWNIVYEEKVK